MSCRLLVFIFLCISQQRIVNGASIANGVNNADVFVHMFEWSWSDIAIECTDFLGPAGFTAVQVSPPQEHIEGSQWWTRYQPVSYQLVSRSGDESAFKKMVQTCASAGVDIYVDAVINHMADGSGTGVAGTSYGDRSYDGTYQANQLHHDFDNDQANCRVDNFDDRNNVQLCDLEGLPDLNTTQPDVQQTIRDYLSDCIATGVAGFRVDAAKHIPADELAVIEPKSSFFFHEVSAGGAVQQDEYFSMGRVTEFDWATSCIGPFAVGKMSQLADCTRNLMSSDKAVIFVDNHDTCRSGEAPLTYKDGQIYQLANVFMLAASPYGYPKVLSDYEYSDNDQGPPDYQVNGGDCGPWICSHRWPYVTELIKFRQHVGSASIDNVDATDDGLIAFSRGDQGFVAINTKQNGFNTTEQTGLPAGSYADHLSDQVVDVGEDGMATFWLEAQSALVLY